MNKKESNDKQIINGLIKSLVISLIILGFLYIILDLSKLVLLGTESILYGLTHFYLRDKIWFFWWKLSKTKPIYVNLFGIFWILFGILLTILGFNG